MIKITIQNNNINERKYILDVIFNEFLGLEYTLHVGSKDYEIELENKKFLTIEDKFFSKYPKDLEYLHIDNVPSKIEELDIFSASFFMLTRWEEYVNKNRDAHDRFPAYESLAFKQGFLDRPVVNEYVEELKSMLFELDNNLKFRIQNSQLFLTHDVDYLYRYQNIKNRFFELGGDLIKRRNLLLFLNNILRQSKVLLGIEKDPYDTYDYLMDISESLHVKSYFFLHSSSASKFDIKNNDLKKVVDNILDRGHFIGYHPSYNAYNNYEIFMNDKEEIEHIINKKLTFGRAHYLRFEIPTTWQIWEDAGMEWDSTLSYADKEGFRCGVCYEYNVFNILTRQKLNLKEKPLIAMEVNFTTYQPDIDSSKMEGQIKFLMNKVEKYNGEFVFLWHNSSFNLDFWKKYQNIYEQVLK